MHLKNGLEDNLKGAFGNTTRQKQRGFTLAAIQMLKIKPGLGLKCKLLVRSIYSHPAVMAETCSLMFFLLLCRTIGTFLL